MATLDLILNIYNNIAVCFTNVTVLQAFYKYYNWCYQGGDNKWRTELKNNISRGLLGATLWGLCPLHPSMHENLRRNSNFHVKMVVEAQSA